MLPPTYTAVLDEINHRTTTQVTTYENELKHAHERHRVESDALTKRTLDYLNTGVADLTNRQCIYIKMRGSIWGKRGFGWSQYFRQLARDLRRPFVRVRWHYYWHPGPGHAGYNTPTLYLPKRKYLAPVESMLLLASDELVTCGGNTVDRWYTFKGEAAVELYNEWRRMVTTDEQCRRALRVI